MKHIDFAVFQKLYSKAPQKAFNMLYDHYAEAVYYLILRRVKQHEDAHDLLQTTFIKVWENVGKFEGQSRIYSWIYRIAINETNMFFRKKKTVSLEDQSQLIFESQVYEHHDIPPEKIDRFLFEAIDQLPEKQKLIFELRYFEELPFDQIVAQIGGTTGSHKASYHIARKKIEDFLKAKLNFI